MPQDLAEPMTLPDPTDPVALAQALIRCPSVTPQEGGALALLEALLAPRGFAVHRPVFSAEGLPDVENLYARFGTAGPVLVIAGHTDVVPPGDAALWRHDPFAAVIEGGKLYGRGACDMKGGLAATVAAALRHLEAAGEAFTGSIALLVTGDEEGASINGTKKLLEWAAARGERFDHALLAEPTNPKALGDMVKIGRRGSLSATLTVHGRQGHAAYPHLADNPVPKLLKLAGALLEPLDAGSGHFAASNLEIVSVDVGNTAFNVIPAAARAMFNVRFNDRWSLASLEAEIRRRLAAAAGNASWELAVKPGGSESFLTAPGPFVEMVSAAIEAETGRRPELSTSGGTSDARFIKDYCPIVEFGLVGDTMHQVDERTTVADLEQLTRIYERILAGYFGGGNGAAS